MSHSLRGNGTKAERARLALVYDNNNFTHAIFVRGILDSLHIHLLYFAFRQSTSSISQLSTDPICSDHQPRFPAEIIDIHFQQQKRARPAALPTSVQGTPLTFTLLIPNNTSDLPLNRRPSKRLPNLPTLPVHAHNHNLTTLLQSNCDQISSFTERKLPREQPARRPELRECQTAVGVDCERGQRVRWDERAVALVRVREVKGGVVARRDG